MGCLPEEVPSQLGLGEKGQVLGSLQALSKQLDPQYSTRVSYRSPLGLPSAVCGS